MTSSELLARFDKRLRKHILKFPSSNVCWFYSNARKLFIEFLQNYPPNKAILVNEDLRIKLWDIEFANGLMNAAGMFKGGFGYETCAMQGAGAYLAGTTTSEIRSGNKKNGIIHPFFPFPNSNASINWMGLPNEGHETVARRLSEIEKFPFCPVGSSLSITPNQELSKALIGLTNGMFLYERANIDFIEINESCPNVEHSCGEQIDNGLDSELVNRLDFVSNNFLKKRKRNLPVIVKFSNDTEIEQIPALLNCLITLKFDGVNFGNTSVNYSEFKSKINKGESEHFNYFSETFGGGISGSFLKEKSLRLCSESVKYLNEHKAAHEFNVIRTGGVESSQDIIDSKQNGILMNQWFTGYFEQFACFGHQLYKETLENNVSSDR